VDTVLVPVGADLYAVPIGWVREVVTATSLTPLVTAPRMVLGLFNLRGEIVPLLDTAALLGVGGPAAVEFAVVLRTHLGPVGLSASAFPKRAILDERIGPSELASSAGSYRVDEEVAVLLDVQQLLDSLMLPGYDRIDESDPHSSVRVRSG
jgi:purine-binding chemotaxis protein CheW